MKKQLKKLPKFDSEDAEREFWGKNDSTEFIDWSNSDKDVLSNLKLSESSSSNLKDWYYELSNEDKESILRGVKDIENGNFLTSEEFWARYEDRIKLSKSR